MNENPIEMSNWPFDPLDPLSYDVICADPPWPFDVWSEKGNGKSPNHHYETMTFEDIQALPVLDLARGDAVLACWACSPTLDRAIETVKAWGFAYKTILGWQKITRKGRQSTGLGYWARTQHEHVILATHGSPARRKALPSLFQGVVGPHSRKPDEFYTLVRERMAGVRRCDLFSAGIVRPGYEGWGVDHRVAPRHGVTGVTDPETPRFDPETPSAPAAQGVLL